MNRQTEDSNAEKIETEIDYCVSDRETISTQQRKVSNQPIFTNRNGYWVFWESFGRIFWENFRRKVDTVKENKGV